MNEEAIPSMFTPVGQLDQFIAEMDKILDKANDLAEEERDGSNCPNCHGQIGHFHPMYSPREMEHAVSKLQEAIFWIEEAKQTYIDTIISKPKSTDGK